MGDSLYACQNLFKICEGYGWKYICRFKAGSIPTVAREFETFKQSSLENHLEVTIENKEDEVKQFVFLTNLTVKKENVKGLTRLGRSRWIENEEFNRQKNLIHFIQHVNSHNTNAMKNHYLMAQIADILMQLYILKVV